MTTVTETTGTFCALPTPELAQLVRERVLEMGTSADGTHIGGSLSATDVLALLYNEVLRLRPEEPDWADRDRFILSKGHASAALYAVLAARGFLPAEELASYGVTGGRLAGHPLRRLPGVEFPSGSLGHGLSLGVGSAIAARRQGRGSRVFVLMGDGEIQEGSVWEAAMSAAHLRLGNLTAVVDRNRLQITGYTEERMGLEPLADKWRSFGWETVEVDGHDLDALRAVFTAPPAAGDRPTMVIAETVKGKGVPLFEDKKKSHSVKLGPTLHRRALGGLRARSRRQP
ncbi:transketolase [Streptomyces sp. NPDC060000]|uniref:transketolase n=1 Tax=Streptomyces sp. NPDC060000 TaxID=3347031 RepID=UPI0036BF27FC